MRKWKLLELQTGYSRIGRRKDTYKDLTNTIKDEISIKEKVEAQQMTKGYAIMKQSLEIQYKPRKNVREIIFLPMLCLENQVKE